MVFSLISLFENTHDTPYFPFIVFSTFICLILFSHNLFPQDFLKNLDGVNVTCTGLPHIGHFGCISIFNFILYKDSLKDNESKYFEFTNSVSSEVSYL